eukprot:TRINITY_DN5814_c0_g2_i2.p1 TRINITY_DN5814_c0_g2~~TRINITY_DN5814_c0_g2_i2.p1  ORF type:complete len:165 (+),score=14.57 TRINITY_DN5814_c0_g2_i2:222-716(+)
MYSSSSADARASNQHLSRSEMTIFPTFPTYYNSHEKDFLLRLGQVVTKVYSFRSEFWHISLTWLNQYICISFGALDSYSHMEQLARQTLQKYKRRGAHSKHQVRQEGTNGYNPELMECHSTCQHGHHFSRQTYKLREEQSREPSRLLPPLKRCLKTDYSLSHWF